MRLIRLPLISFLPTTATLLFAVAFALAPVPTTASDAREYSPHAFVEHPTRVYFGDTHVHSSFSMDANAIGNTRLSPAAAYRFAKGEAVVSNSGLTAKLGTPLDFLVVSDHSEYMGLLPALRRREPALVADPKAKRLADGLTSSSDGGMATIGELIGTLMRNEPILDNADFKQNIWNEITRLADEANDPGRFTALIGFEWTSMPGGDNLHRVVVYGDDGPKASKRAPVSAFDGDQPEDLWKFMEEYAASQNGRILAIPHNANLSNGRMFALRDSKGEPFSSATAERRARLEPLVEVTQIKGDGETHPLLSPDDEFADFETWDFGNLNVVKTVPKSPGQIQFEYARAALKLGLAEAARTGVNPYQFGMIGSTDAHTSLATAAEDDFWGKAVSTAPAARAKGVSFDVDGETGILFGNWDFVASGYAAVWATENTRSALFEAMQRREVYATTGSRMTVRFFGGWDYEKPDAHAANVAQIGYAKGVPMGGELGAAGKPAGDRAPTFLVTALKDPVGANLDRIQIVKGWRKANGDLAEKVYNVALSDGRRSVLGRVRALESTVDRENATYTNEFGDALLTAHWRDPDFDASEGAFYYARVIEIATPRWNVYDEKRLGVPTPEGFPTQVQDRAYTSPIWYTP